MSDFFCDFYDIKAISSIVIVLPGLQGGGMKRHAYEMANEWVKQGYMVVLLESYGRIIDLTFKLNKTKKVSIILGNNEKEIIKLLNALNIRLIHYHHFLFTTTLISDLPQILAVPYFISVHDYFFVCPIQFLTNKFGVYCGEPYTNKCTECLMEQFDLYSNNLPEWASNKYAIDIVKWRKWWHVFLKKAEAIFVPNEDVSERLAKYFPDLQFKIFENPEIIFPTDLDDGAIYKRDTNKNSTMVRIGILGRLNSAKGADILINCAKYIEQHKLPIKFILFGTIDDPKRVPENIKVLGSYEETKVYKLILNQKIDYFWFPGVLPETYSYTLSIAIRLCIPVLSTNLGAIANRIIKNRWGTTYPYGLATSQLCDELLNFDYKYFYHHKENFKLKNLNFPDARNLYSKKPFNEELDVDWSVAENAIKKIADTNFQNQLNNITAIELKKLMEINGNLAWKIKQILHLNKNAIYSFLYNNLSPKLLYKIYKMFFNRGK